MGLTLFCTSKRSIVARESIIMLSLLDIADFTIARKQRVLEAVEDVCPWVFNIYRQMDDPPCLEILQNSKWFLLVDKYNDSNNEGTTFLSPKLQLHPHFYKRNKTEPFHDNDPKCYQEKQA